jgi:hypothetical protein
VNNWQILLLRMLKNMVSSEQAGLDNHENLDATTVSVLVSFHLFTLLSGKSFGCCFVMTRLLILIKECCAKY